MSETIDNSTRFTKTAIIASKERNEKFARYAFLSMTLAMILPLLLIVSFLVYKAWPSLSPSFILDMPKNGMKEGGIWPAFLGTLYLVLISLMIAAPIGVMAAVYLNEYAKDNWLTRTINLAVINLAGVPSIVHALFGLGAFVYAAKMGTSVIAASLTLAVMTLPVIIASTKEALSAVPMSFRQASWNMGVSRWQTIWRIVLPNSISGILTGIILQVSRAAGETAPIMFTGAVISVNIAKDQLFAYGLTDECMALAMHLYTISTQIPNVPESLQFAIAVALLGVVLLVNALSISLRVYLRTHRKW